MRRCLLTNWRFFKLIDDSAVTDPHSKTATTTQGYCVDRTRIDAKFAGASARGMPLYSLISQFSCVSQREHLAFLLASRQHLLSTPAHAHRLHSAYMASL